jgi:hypothetical protein
MSLAQIAEEWMKAHAAGEIKYDPHRVESRWLPAPSGNDWGFKTIFNAKRKDRPAQKAA